MDGALPAMGVAGISNTSTSSPPPVSGAPKLFVTGLGAAGSVLKRSTTKEHGNNENSNQCLPDHYAKNKFCLVI